MLTDSNIWEQTVIIDDTRRSRSETVFFFCDTGFDDARGIAEGYLDKRKSLLGRGYDDAGNIVNSAAPGTPCLYALRLHNARNKRHGRTIVYERDTYLSDLYTFGVGTDDEKVKNRPADPVFNTLYTRLFASVTGRSGGAPDLYPQRQFQIHGVPDGLTVVGKKAIGGDTLTRWHTAYTALMRYMTSHSYGMMVMDDASPNQKRELIAAEHDGNGNAIVTVSAASTITGIADGDQVRISEANAKGWNGDYYVTISDAPTRKLLLAQGPISGIPLFTHATLQRLRAGDGVVTKLFAPFYKDEIKRVSSTPAGGPFARSRGKKKSGRRKLPKWASALVVPS